MNPKSISMIHKQLMTYFKVKYGSILNGYYKSSACTQYMGLVLG